MTNIHKCIAKLTKISNKLCGFPENKPMTGEVLGVSRILKLLERRTTYHLATYFIIFLFFFPMIFQFLLLILYCSSLAQLQLWIFLLCLCFFIDDTWHSNATSAPPRKPNEKNRDCVHTTKKQIFGCLFIFLHQ